jgi:hypothetical protein
MSLDEILDEWKVDAVIDKTCLGDEAMNIPRLHEKYLRMISKEFPLLKRIEGDYKALELEKREHYIQGPTKESQEKGWYVPPIGRVMKNDVQPYLDADIELRKKNMEIAYQNQKVETLKDILKKIHTRSFDIGHAISYEKFQAGA